MENKKLNEIERRLASIIATAQLARTVVMMVREDQRGAPTRLLDMVAAIEADAMHNTNLAMDLLRERF
jgi:hypothetical protein